MEPKVEPKVVVKPHKESKHDTPVSKSDKENVALNTQASKSSFNVEAKEFKPTTKQ